MYQEGHEMISANIMTQSDDCHTIDKVVYDRGI